MVTNSKSRRAATTSPGVDIDKMARFVRAKASAFLKDPNITSVGIGYKTRDGKPTNELAIQFTVHQKVQPELLSEVGSELIPEHIEIDGVSVPTDILERSFKPAFTVVEPAAKDERKARADVLRPGLSIGNIVTTAGTLGCFARQRGDGRVVMLSNWHVLHGADVELGVDVVQPGRHDDNRIAQNVVGKLLRSHLGPFKLATYGATDIFSTTNDLRLFATSLLNGKLLSMNSLTLMTQMQTPNLQPIGGSYGYGFFVLPGNQRLSVFYHTGDLDGFRSLLRINKNKGCTPLRLEMAEMQRNR